jgi:hypothetical protein
MDNIHQKTIFLSQFNSFIIIATSNNNFSTKQHVMDGNWKTRIRIVY